MRCFLITVVILYLGMELHLYTAQIGKYKGPDAYDVTVKSGDINFEKIEQVGDDITC